MTMSLRSTAAALSEREPMKEDFNLDDLIDILVVETGLSTEGINISTATRLPDVGLDSLAFLQVQAVVYDRYGLELDENLQDGSFGEMVHAVSVEMESRVGNR
jgi:acyl carrier protein